MRVVHDAGPAVQPRDREANVGLEPLVALVGESLARRVPLARQPGDLVRQGFFDPSGGNLGLPGHRPVLSRCSPAHPVQRHVHVAQVRRRACSGLLRSQARYAAVKGSSNWSGAARCSVTLRTVCSVFSPSVWSGRRESAPNTFP